MKENTKYIILALLLFFTGIYTIAFGIYSIAITHLWFSGLALVISGLLGLFLGISGIFEWQIDRPHGPNGRR
jgi:hypothetical protein